MRRLLSYLFTIACIGLLAAIVYGLSIRPSRGAILKQSFHLNDYDVRMARTNHRSRSSRADAKVARGDAVFDKPGAFEAYVDSLDDPKWRSISWPPQGTEPQVVPLHEAVGWRDLTAADQPVWRKMTSLGRPAGKSGRILCFYIVLEDEARRGVPCEDAPATSLGRIWAGLDPENRAIYMRVEFAEDEAPGVTGYEFLDYLVDNA